MTHNAGELIRICARQLVPWETPLASDSCNQSLRAMDRVQQSSASVRPPLWAQQNQFEEIPDIVIH
jgi:hypothetical protein